MENVSKVLLIAATILITIIIITLGISIVNSQKNINDEVSTVGKLIELKTGDTADIIEGYSVKRYADVTIEDPKNGYYIDFSTGIKIDKKVTYIISFDYIIERKGEYDIYCSIGVDNQEEDTFIYNSDLEPRINYLNQNIGEKSTFTFELKPNDNKYKEKFEHYKSQYENNNLSLSIRFARTNFPSEFKVKIENIKIKYK